MVCQKLKPSMLWKTFQEIKLWKFVKSQLIFLPEKIRNFFVFFFTPNVIIFWWFRLRCLHNIIQNRWTNKKWDVKKVVKIFSQPNVPTFEQLFETLVFSFISLYSCLFIKYLNYINVHYLNYSNVHNYTKSVTIFYKSFPISNVDTNNRTLKQWTSSYSDTILFLFNIHWKWFERYILQIHFIYIKGCHICGTLIVIDLFLEEQFKCNIFMFTSTTNVHKTNKWNKNVDPNNCQLQKNHIKVF